MPLFHNDPNAMRRATKIVNDMCDTEIKIVAQEADRKHTITLTASQIALAGALAKQELRYVHLAPPEAQEFLSRDLNALISEAKRVTWDIAVAKGYAKGERPE